MSCGRCRAPAARSSGAVDPAVCCAALPRRQQKTPAPAHSADGALGAHSSSSDAKTVSPPCCRLVSATTDPSLAVGGRWGGGGWLHLPWLAVAPGSGRAERRRCPWGGSAARQQRWRSPRWRPRRPPCGGSRRRRRRRIPPATTSHAHCCLSRAKAAPARVAFRQRLPSPSSKGVQVAEGRGQQGLMWTQRVCIVDCARPVHTISSGLELRYTTPRVFPTQPAAPTTCLNEDLAGRCLLAQRLLRRSDFWVRPFEPMIIMAPYAPQADATFSGNSYCVAPVTELT